MYARIRADPERCYLHDPLHIDLNSKCRNRCIHKSFPQYPGIHHMCGKYSLSRFHLSWQWKAVFHICRFRSCKCSSYWLSRIGQRKRLVPDREPVQAIYVFSWLLSPFIVSVEWRSNVSSYFVTSPAWESPPPHLKNNPWHPILQDGIMNKKKQESLVTS